MSDELEPLIDAFIAKQAELGYAPNSGASPELLDRLEQENRWKFPPAMRRLLLKSNGCDSCKGVDWPWVFPCVENWVEYYVDEANSNLQSRGYVAFCDAHMWAPTCEICMDGRSQEWGRVYLFNGDDKKPYIGSFEKFMHHWIHTSESTVWLDGWESFPPAPWREV